MNKWKEEMFNALIGLYYYLKFIAEFTLRELSRGNFSKLLDFWAPLLFWPDLIFRIIIFLMWEAYALPPYLATFDCIEIDCSNRYIPLWMNTAVVDFYFVQIPVFVFHLFYLYISIVFVFLVLNFFVMWFGL